MRRQPWRRLLGVLLLAVFTVTAFAAARPAAASGLFGWFTADDSSGLLGGYGYESSDNSQAYGDPYDSGSASGTDSRTKDGKKNGAKGKAVTVTEDGYYTSKDEVALYLHMYGHLPGNFVTKRQAEKAGFGSTYRTVDEAYPGKSIGGSHFGNYEGLLPEGNYRECDIDYHGGRRGAKRIVWSDDGAIYYTKDHYESFERLY